MAQVPEPEQEPGQSGLKPEPEPEPEQEPEQESEATEFATVVAATMRSASHWRDGAWFERYRTEQAIEVPPEQRLPPGVTHTELLRYLMAFAINSWCVYLIRTSNPECHVAWRWVPLSNDLISSHHAHTIETVKQDSPSTVLPESTCNELSPAHTFYI
jgi:hypothetical protein